MSKKIRFQYEYREEYYGQKIIFQKTDDDHRACIFAGGRIFLANGGNCFKCKNKQVSDQTEQKKCYSEKQEKVHFEIEKCSQKGEDHLGHLQREKLYISIIQEKNFRKDQSEEKRNCQSYRKSQAYQNQKNKKACLHSQGQAS